MRAHTDAIAGAPATEVVYDEPDARTTPGRALDGLLDSINPETEPLVLTVMQHWAEAVLRAGRVMLDRQRKYGCSNIAVFGAAGVVVRASDKVNRLKHAYFESDATETPDESLEDSFLDLLNYSAIGRTCQLGLWPRA